eukprot:TRINITY_DN16662_c0_g2_i3.p1 TRINITY_DN16662_c0_g2~~TRINITY_DN16662_c0_g2_i3.p1  ORF type:complete len:363 (+),score=79.08 TRINITY_DN16662_c0_g2_i3:53-1141(+)
MGASERSCSPIRCRCCQGLGRVTFYGSCPLCDGVGFLGEDAAWGKCVPLRLYHSSDSARDVLMDRVIEKEALAAGASLLAAATHCEGSVQAAVRDALQDGGQVCASSQAARDELLLDDVLQFLRSEDTRWEVAAACGRARGRLEPSTETLNELKVPGGFDPDLSMTMGGQLLVSFALALCSAAPQAWLALLAQVSQANALDEEAAAGDGGEACDRRSARLVKALGYLGALVLQQLVGTASARAVLDTCVQPRRSMIGTLVDPVVGETFELALCLDRSPSIDGLEILFTQNKKQCGYILFEKRVSPALTFALRGMRIYDSLRGKGLMKVFLAVWLLFCLKCEAQPTTIRIDKPLIALGLLDFG